ncbi:hypothetical protein [Candidatus Contendibacter odensensis]|uniref:Uncharacterized protein n=1 Tax=Candidatus Contendobacter odensis Run_B_J11 TaxID=1400861 RepID=A0A7U7G8V1_9GAMM|nr:hypothetical protein [Candidatus Contendobacter odensis]CDH43710.1 hypothetical protein BN874_130035 [Candidatus Contendobacter odensis Run_B_J11]
MSRALLGRNSPSFQGGIKSLLVAELPQLLSQRWADEMLHRRQKHALANRLSQVAGTSGVQTAMLDTPAYAITEAEL